MPRPDAAVLAVRRAVDELVRCARAQGYLATGHLAIAVSGGADSLALAAASAYVASRTGLQTHGLIVDHGLQAESASVARRAATQLDELGIDQVRILPVTVDRAGGVEAAARRARYTALRSALPAPDSLVLLGHTKDDQAETVLLGLGRGSGVRSIAAMRRLAAPWARPLLDVSRATTLQACTALGLQPWHDPHNTDPAFTRVRLRHEVLPLLDEVLQGGVVDALARTAAQLQEDCDALDLLADKVLERATDSTRALVADELAPHPTAIRRRILRRWLLAAGATDLTDQQLRAVDDFVGRWRGQGEVLLKGSLVVGRKHGRLLIDRVDPDRN